MKTLELDIFSDTDEDEVMKYLRVLEDKHLIGLRKSKSTVLPGEPLTVEELNRQIDIEIRFIFYDLLLYS